MKNVWSWNILKFYPLFLIASFRLVMNVVFFLFGNSSASEFYMPTFRNTLCSIFIDGVSRKNNRDDIVGLFIGGKVWLENRLSQPERDGTGRGHVQVEKHYPLLVCRG
jgi:hypothetical protein